MPYTYLDDIATADVAFRATGKSLEEMFVAAWDATLSAMVDNSGDIAAHSSKDVSLSSPGIDTLLFQFLQELIYYKDAESVLLRVDRIKIKEEDSQYNLFAKTFGERIDISKHHMKVDVKAVTMHRFEVVTADNGFEATVVLDI